MEPAEVQVIVGEFYVALDERSEMKNTQLASMGYTPEEIELLQKYAAGEELSVSEYRAIAGTCTGDIIKGTFFITGLGAEDFTDLSPELMKKYKQRFWNIELFIPTPNADADCNQGLTAHTFACNGK